MCPKYGPLKATYKVYARYVRIPGLRAHTRGSMVSTLGFRVLSCEFTSCFHYIVVSPGSVSF